MSVKMFLLTIRIFFLIVYTLFTCEAFLLQSPRLTNWGDWGTIEKCSSGQFVTGMQLKIETDQGLTKDDTALNGVKFFCGSLVSNPDTDSPITSSIGPWGFWRRITFCASDFSFDESPHTSFHKSVAVGFQLRSEGARGSRDDTAANNLILICANINPVNGQFENIEKIQGDGTSWGSWTDEQMCPPQHAICGLATQIELSKGRRHDDTSLNNLNVECCRIELHTFNPNEHELNNTNKSMFINTTTASLAVEGDTIISNRDYEAEIFPAQENENNYVTRNPTSNTTMTDKSTSEIISNWFGSKNITLPIVLSKDYIVSNSWKALSVTESLQTATEESNTVSTVSNISNDLSIKISNSSVNNHNYTESSKHNSYPTVVPTLEADDDYDDVEVLVDENDIIFSNSVVTTSTLRPKIPEESLDEYPESDAKQQYDSAYEYKDPRQIQSANRSGNANRINIFLFSLLCCFSFKSFLL